MPEDKDSWYSLFEKAFADTGENWEDVEDTTLTEEQKHQKFDSGYGEAEGCAFTLWTKNYVYFPVVYDGAEWIGYVPRNPNGVATPHRGGQ